MPNDSNEGEVEPAMSDLTSESEHISRTTSRSVCHAVGERLQRDLPPEHSTLPSQLAKLMDELRRQDGG